MHRLFQFNRIYSSKKITLKIKNKKLYTNVKEIKSKGDNVGTCVYLGYMSLWFLFINLGNSILPTSVQLLAPGSSQWQIYFIYLSSKFLCKDSTNKMYEVWILDVCKNAWT